MGYFKMFFFALIFPLTICVGKNCPPKGGTTTTPNIHYKWSKKEKKVLENQVAMVTHLSQADIKMVKFIQNHSVGFHGNQVT